MSYACAIVVHTQADSFIHKFEMVSGNSNSNYTAEGQSEHAFFICTTEY